MENSYDEQKTFESRLRYIFGIFSDPYTQTEIMRNCIAFKLNKSFEQYIDDLEKSFKLLTGRDNPVPVLRSIEKGDK